MSRRVLIVGCGEIGSRHLQAVASLAEVGEVDVVDPRPEALELGRQRLAELPNRPKTTIFRWLSSTEEASRGGDLCIMATQAAGRYERVVEVVERLDYNSFLLEKVVAQSIRECENLLTFVNSGQLAVWVNCKVRAYPIHRHLKWLLDSAEPMLFAVIGGNHGLVSNGIHMADLFAFYDGAAKIDSAGSRINPVLVPSKRGNGLFDLSGIVQGASIKGSRFTLMYAQDHHGPEIISINTRRHRFLVDHFSRWASESSEAGGWSWHPVSFEGDLLISQMSRVIVSEILTSGSCALPTLGEALIAHRFVLGEVQPVFHQLLGRELDACPVT